MSEEFYVSNRQLYSGVSSNSGKFWTVSDIFSEFIPNRGSGQLICSHAVAVAVVAGPWHEWWQSRSRSIPSAVSSSRQQPAVSFWHSDVRIRTRGSRPSRTAAIGHFYTPTSRWRLPAPCILHSLLLKLQKHRGQAFQIICFQMII